ncbi:MAG: ATP-dependent DNA helicase RecG [Alphaproteobacteria bacterium]
MRPEILFPVFTPITSLKGVGPRIGGLIENAAGSRTIDLLWHLPNAIIDRKFSPKLLDAPAGVIATFTVRATKHEVPRHNRQPYKIYCENDDGALTLVFFHGQKDYLEKQLPPGEVRVVSGRVEHYHGQIQITHPDHITTIEESQDLPLLEPVYRLTTGLTPKPLSKAIAAALAHTPKLPEWIDSAFLKKNRWPSWNEAIRSAHAPSSTRSLEPSAPARQRLAYDELLANQLAIALLRRHIRQTTGRSITGSNQLRKKILSQLPFSLTESQTRALDEIIKNMSAETRMLRLLHGDVGSGKTVVAFLAMVNAVEAGGQASLMAPTEVLARQHLATIETLAQSAGISCAALTGRTKGKARANLLADLKAGQISILVGTHAMFQSDVSFANLALTVIDEQHKFGVHQRLNLQAKGHGVDLLVMTATPIPRTLMMTSYGDMDVSRLTEKPAGRQLVNTVVLPIDRFGDVVTAIKRGITSGGRVYWVCPLVDESGSVDLAAAEERFATLETYFGSRVGLVHGRLNEAKRDSTMSDFANGQLDILVATTVIEVGVDVPEATIMVIEQAERFGLAQLHQLRGRVGRSDKPSSCLLLYATPLTKTARARLNILRETDDGFQIAEEDLRLRGAGELLGTRQSGLPNFHLAELPIHGELLAAAEDDAKLILTQDEVLEGQRGEALRTLLYLFERDAAISLLRSG